MNVKDSYPILGWLFKGFNLLAGLADLVPIGAMEDPNRRHHLIKANLWHKHSATIFFQRTNWTFLTNKFPITTFLFLNEKKRTFYTTTSSQAPRCASCNADKLKS